MGVRQIPDIIFKQDHYRQTRSLLAFLDHFENAGIGDGETNHRTDGFARIIGSGNAKSNLVARNIVGAVRGDPDFELVFRLPEKQALRHRSIVAVVNGCNDDAIQRLWNSESNIRRVVSPEGNAFEGELFATLRQTDTVGSFCSRADTDNRVYLFGSHIRYRRNDGAGFFDGRQRKDSFDSGRLGNAEEIRFALRRNEGEPAGIQTDAN